MKLTVRNYYDVISPVSLKYIFCIRYITVLYVLLNILHIYYDILWLCILTILFFSKKYLSKNNFNASHLQNYSFSFVSSTICYINYVLWLIWGARPETDPLSLFLSGRMLRSWAFKPMKYPIHSERFDHEIYHQELHSYLCGATYFCFT